MNSINTISTDKVSGKKVNKDFKKSERRLKRKSETIDRYTPHQSNYFEESLDIEGSTDNYAAIQPPRCKEKDEFTVASEQKIFDMKVSEGEESDNIFNLQFFNNKTSRRSSGKGKITAMEEAQTQIKEGKLRMDAYDFKKNERTMKRSVEKQKRREKSQQALNQFPEMTETTSNGQGSSKVQMIDCQQESDSSGN